MYFYIISGDAVKWNKRTFAGSDRGEHFSDLSVAQISDFQQEVRQAKGLFRLETTGDKVSWQNIPTSYMCSCARILL